MLLSFYVTDSYMRFSVHFCVCICCINTFCIAYSDVCFNNIIMNDLFAHLRRRIHFYSTSHDSWEERPDVIQNAPLKGRSK